MAAAHDTCDTAPLLVLTFSACEYHDWAVDVQVRLFEPLVDYIVIVESDATFTNIDRDYCFHKHASDRVLVCRVRSARFSNAYANDFLQRSTISQGLQIVRDRHPNRALCVVVIDADEFIEPDSIVAIREWARAPFDETKHPLVCIPMLCFTNGFYKMNAELWYRAIVFKVGPHTPIPCAARARWALTPPEALALLDAKTTEEGTAVLSARAFGPPHPLRDTRGYHLSSFAVHERAIETKLRSFAHGAETHEKYAKDIVAANVPQARSALDTNQTEFIATDVAAVFALMSSTLRDALSEAIPTTSVACTGRIDPLPTLVLDARDGIAYFPHQSDIDALDARLSDMKKLLPTDACVNACVVRCGELITKHAKRRCALSRVRALPVVILHEEDPWADRPLVGERIKL